MIYKEVNYGNGKKTQSGKWRVQVAKTIDGKLIKKSITADTKAEAEYKAEKWKSGIKEEFEHYKKPLFIRLKSVRVKF